MWVVKIWQNFEKFYKKNVKLQQIGLKQITW